MIDLDEKRLTIEYDIIKELVGEGNINLRSIERGIPVKVNLRGGDIIITGEKKNIDVASRFIKQLIEITRMGFTFSPVDIGHALRLMKNLPSADLKDYFLDTVFITERKRPIVPRSHGQKLYIGAMRGYDIVFGIGPAGTGKTYLAMAMALSCLMKRTVSRIVLVRPAIEAGEKIGYLPGDMLEKINPYLRPLYDALHDMLDFSRASKLVERGIIEVAPLGFMRGRTLNDAFVILDEAQNTTSEQMKMFLTRLGLGSRAVITGDITQIDLPQDKISGLIEAQEIFRKIERISFVYFDERDVVRHPLVQEIIKAYEEKEKEKRSKTRSTGESYR